MRSPAPGLAKLRLRVASGLLVLAFAGLAARAAHLCLVDTRGASRGRIQSERVLALAPERGAILDRSGAELALSGDAPSVYAIGVAPGDLDSAARRLGQALGRDPAELARRLKGERFTFLARWVGKREAERVQRLSLPGVGILPEPRRVYPHGELAGTVLGFANIDGAGVRGIEQQEDAWLRGVSRRLPVERDARGRLLVAAGKQLWGTAGGQIALTLDAALQADAERELRLALQETGARGGTVIALAPASGEILALAEAPGFDPNRFRELPYAASRSRAFLDAIEPGSTFKVFLVAAALERGAIEPSTRFDCEHGSFRVPGKTIRDEHPQDVLDPGGILRVSSNVGAVKIAQALGPRAHQEMLGRFGFGRVTGSGFPEESAGLLRSWRGWRPVDHATIAFGQGVSVTPIQLATALAALANGGELLRPRLVAARRAPGGPWIASRPERVARVVRREVAARVLAMLEGVVGSEGTGRRAGLRGVRVAGKTGTAQKLEPATGSYGDRFVAWFAGVVPAEAPRLAIVVALDEPRRPHHTGGAAAAPLFARVAAAQLARFGIQTTPQLPAPPTEPIRVAAASPRAAAPKPAAAPRAAAPGPAAGHERPEFTQLGDRVLVPDLTGLTGEEVRKITERNAVLVEITGRGRVVAQEPSPGSVLTRRHQVMRLRLAQGSGEES